VDEISLKHGGRPFEHGQRITDSPDCGVLAIERRSIGRLGHQDRPENR
jgi:hypothetical protein